MSRTIKSDHGSLSGLVADKPTDEQAVPCSTLVVHRFTIDEYDDPDLFAGKELYEWTITDAGKWVLDRCVETPSWHRRYRVDIMANEYIITAKLSKVDITAFYLKWS
jgi:hypothetical protein